MYLNKESNAPAGFSAEKCAGAFLFIYGISARC